MQLPLAVVAAVAITSVVAELDRFSYNPIECAWYGTPDGGCVDPNTIQCPNGTKKVHGPSSNGMDIDASLRLTNRVHYYAPGFGHRCEGGGTRVFCCRDPPSDQTRIRTPERVPVVNCAWAGYTVIDVIDECKDGDCPDGYEEKARTDGYSSRDASTLGYPTRELKGYEYTPLGFSHPCDWGTRPFCCPTTPQYIDPPIDNVVKFANPLNCGWLPYSNITHLGKCMKISTCPPDYMLLYRSATGQNVDPPLNLHAPAFGKKCDSNFDKDGSFDPDRFDEGTKAFCCKKPFRFGQLGVPAVNCAWRGDGPWCSAPDSKYGCGNTDAFEELAYTDGLSLQDVEKYGYPYYQVNGTFSELYVEKYLPIGFGDACTWYGKKSFCCPKGEATNHRAFNALVVE